MGMFDELKCSADIGELTNVSCQTKDIDNMMSFFWVDPSGFLWCPDYSGTQDIYFVETKFLLGSMKYKPNGNRGKLRRVYITNYVFIYDTKTSPDGYAEIVECRLHFIDGILQDYTYINNHILS